MFLQRAHGKTDDLQFIAMQQRLQIEDENFRKANKHAPWLIDPETSHIYKVLLVLVTVALQFEFFCIPLVLVWPELK